jgi:hypothetical protein
MKKQNVISKNQSKSNFRSSLCMPEVHNMDALSYASDEELDRLHNHLQDEREKAARTTDDLVAWETEICYVQREMKIRTTRRSAHEKYLRSNPDLYQDSYANFD